MHYIEIGMLDEIISEMSKNLKIFNLKIFITVKSFDVKIVGLYKSDSKLQQDLVSQTEIWRLFDGRSLFLLFAN